MLGVAHLEKTPTRTTFSQAHSGLRSPQSRIVRVRYKQSNQQRGRVMDKAVLLMDQNLL
jgi:hypothetical protein